MGNTKAGGAARQCIIKIFYIFRVYAFMGKRKYNPLNNLLGFVNLSNKKRKVAKASCNKKSSKRKLGKENVRVLVHSILLIISLIIV